MRAFGALEDVAELGQHGGRAGVGGIDVEPQVVLLGDLGDGLDGIDAGRRGGAYGGDHAEGAHAAAVVGHQHVAQQVGPHAEGRIDRHLAHVLLAKAEGDGSLFD